jgi:hypothetical protein
MSAEVEQFLNLVDFYSPKQALRAQHICKVMLHIDLIDMEFQYRYEVTNAQKEQCTYVLLMWRNAKPGKIIMLSFDEKLHLSISFKGSSKKEEICRNRNAIQQAQWINTRLTLDYIEKKEFNN